MATSSAQTVPLVEVYDYLLAPGDPSTAATSKGKPGKTVKVTLQYDKALTLSPDPVVWAAQETVYTALTDANGFWHVFVIPNNKITPANTYYTVEIEGGLSYQIQTTDVGVPAPGWQSSASGILLNIPAALAPTTSTVGAITATGLITAQAGINITAGGLVVTGGDTETGGLTVDSLSFSVAVSQITPGGTSISLRNHANNADNLLITDAGNATVRGSLTVTGGGFTVSAGGAAITGNSTVTGTLTVTAGLTVNASGITVTGNSTITGTLVISSNLQALNLILTAGTSLIVPGVTSISLRNNANNADNLLVTDAGLVTLRNALQLPPSAAGTIAPTAYSSVPVKIQEIVTTNGQVNVSFQNIPATFRHLRIIYSARDNGAGTSFSDLSMTIANDGSALYDGNVADFAGSSAATLAEQASATSVKCGLITNGAATASMISRGIIHFPNYRDAFFKSGTFEVAEHHVVGTGANERRHGMWQYRGTAVIARIDILATFAAGCVFTLEGIP